MRSLVLSALLIALAGQLRAQHEHGKAPPGGIGRVRFPTTCAPGAQPAIERGVALLHNFWYEEAAAAFRDAGARDSSCAMAWWGVGMTYVRPLWPPLPLDTLRLGAAAAARASAARTADARERGYVDALAAFYRDLGATAPAAKLGDERAAATWRAELAAMRREGRP